MLLIDKLNEDMKQAMKEKNKEKLSVIRMVKAAMQNEAIHLGVDKLNPEQEMTILAREVKQRNESLKEFSAAGREDLVEKVELELAILQDYMPEQLTDAELEELVKATINELGATSKQDFGKVMGAIMPKVKGRADGSAVQKLVNQLLNG